MDELGSLITNIGFPIAVTCFLLVRLEKKLDDLNKTLLEIMENMTNKSD